MGYALKVCVLMVVLVAVFGDDERRKRGKSEVT